MRTAETVLGVIRDRGQKKLPLEDVYRQLYNPELYLLAYGRIYRNDGAMTKGTTDETVDGMSLRKIHGIIEDLRFERYRWTPVRRMHIPKKNGKTRPLGIPTWSDKLLQEVMRLILETYYEPQFSPQSHGFRPERGCGTALMEVQRNWTGTKWFIEGDIKGCFDNIDHTVMLSVLRENIHDNRFLRLVENLLKAGYLEEWSYKPTLSGSPQGGVISPILSNIYLNRLDRFVEETLVPEHTKGDRRKANPEYFRLNNRGLYLRRKGRVEEAQAMEKAKRLIPCVDVNDPDYRRLRYVRYADDFLLGYVGSKAEAEQIKEKLAKFMKDELHLDLSPEKTLITHAESESARFLGYEITTMKSDSQRDRWNRRSINNHVSLRVPADVVESKKRTYEQNGKPIHRSVLLENSDYDIMVQYQQEYRGLVQYYLLADNVYWLYNVHKVMRISLMKTLAYKHKTSVRRIWKKYGDTVQTPHGPRRCLKAIVTREGKKPLVAYFGGIPLIRQHAAKGIADPFVLRTYKRVELVQRLMADTCEVCGSSEDIEVHHVRKLADLRTKGRPETDGWKRLMAYRRRKTLVLCRSCHRGLHAGRPLAQYTDKEHWRAG